ncbi:hypothetical protein [Variovorax sp. dw_954]|uniref:hypothetical protein n=1 Tax=Variovorax sp. dw_954 TaxID=2720078 RepID=UPI001BD560E1|nr:hypothetical protein [Variovorax sp. dw_954]
MLLAAAGCGQRPDPGMIEGHWVAEKFRMYGIGVPIGPDLTVSRNRIAFGGSMEPLKLNSIAADGDAVTLETEIGFDIVFAFEGKDRMYFSLPITGDRIYYRRSSATETSVAGATAEKGPIQASVAQPASAPVIAKPYLPIPPGEAVAKAIARAPAPAASLPRMGSPPRADAEPARQGSQSPELQYGQAVDAMQRGDADRSLRYLSAALANGFDDWQRIDREPRFNQLNDDVRFQVLRSRWKKAVVLP